MDTAQPCLTVFPLQVIQTPEPVAPMEQVVTLEETLAALVEGKKYTTFRDILITMNASDIAAIFDDLPEAKLPLLFRLLPKELAAETFVEMEPEAQELLIQVIT